MKITKVTSSILHVPNDPPVSAYYPSNTYVLADIETDQGLTGVGYTMLVGGFGARSVKAYLDESLVPLLSGENPLEIDRLYEKMYENDRGIRKKGVPMYAISAMDIGLWDILAQSMNSPVWQVLGGTNAPIKAYGSGGFLPYTIDQLIEEAQGFRAKGCGYYKFKIGREDLMENVERVHTLCDVLSGMRIMVDANQRWDVATNIRIGNALADCDLYWYEEPVLADNIDQCAEVARAISTPVATGENEYTRYGFRDLIEAGAAQFLNPDIHRCGGFSEMMKISHLASAYDLKIAPHLATELSLHVMAAIPNADMVEFLAGMPADLLEDPPALVNGTIALSTKPGHGVRFTAEALKRYSVE
jgi:D-arabinonate dehydratase